MIFKTTLLLISLIWCAQSDETPKNVPVHLFELTNIIIDGHRGNFNTNSMEMFKNVESLTLQNCNFTRSSYNSLDPLENMQNLTVLNTKFGVIGNEPSDCCRKLKEMKMVDSSAGPMPKEDFSLTASTKSLEKLYLIKMDIPEIGTNALVGSNIEELAIDGSKLTTIEDGAFNGMNKLVLLDLQNNNLKKIPTSSLAALKTLKVLNLRNNLFETITAADIPPLPNLEKLNLGDNPVKEINLIGLKEKLPKIKEIDLSGIKIDPSKTEGLPIIKS